MNLSARQYFIFILFFDCLQVFLLRKNIFWLAHLHLLFKFMSGENVTVMEKRLFSNHKIAAWKHIVIFSHLYAVYIDTKKKEKRIWNPFEKWYESKTTTTILFTLCLLMSCCTNKYVISFFYSFEYVYALHAHLLHMWTGVQQKCQLMMIVFLLCIGFKIRFIIESFYFLIFFFYFTSSAHFNRISVLRIAFHILRLFFCHRFAGRQEIFFFINCFRKQHRIAIQLL